MRLIDPPSDFAPLSEWQQFLTEMNAEARQHPEDSDVREWVEIARKEIEAREPASGVSAAEIDEQITEIMQAKGSSIMLADWREVERLLDQLPRAQREERKPWLYEGLSLIVNDPGYDGDIPPVE